MNVIAKARLVQIKPLSRHIGAEIRGIDLRQRPDDETIRPIYQAWLDHLVLVFPEQKLSQEDLLRVTAYFGETGRTWTGRPNITRRALGGCCPASC